MTTNEPVNGFTSISNCKYIAETPTNISDPVLFLKGVCNLKIYLREPDNMKEEVLMVLVLQLLLMVHQGM